MNQFINNNARLKLPKRKRKGIHVHHAGIRSIFYFTADEVVEGTPMKLKATSTATKLNHNYEIEQAAQGDGAKVIGLALQDTYADASVGQLAQLSGYHFANDTAQRLDGMPIGVLTGQGWALLLNYGGTVNPGDQLAVGPSGILVSEDFAGVQAEDKVPVWAESKGTGTNEIRVRFDFGFTTSNAA